MTRLFAGRLAPLAPALPRVDRPSLHEVLDAATARRVCVVLAGPGWGKTTAAGTWVRAGSGAVLPLHPGDESIRHLVAGLLDASRSPLSAAPGQTPSPTDLDHIRDSIGAGGWGGLGEDPAGSPVEDLVLVLDDAQDLLRNTDSIRLVEELCGLAPEWLHIVLMSRSELPFSLKRLRGRGFVADVDAHRLAFGVGEIASLLETTTGEGLPDLARCIQEGTGGWPALVRMIAEEIRDVEPDRRRSVLEQLAGPGGRLWGYLAEEVFAGEPESVYELLRTVAVLDRVTRPLCDYLGFGETTSLLPSLARRGLVQSVPGAEASWSLVPVVRDFFLTDPTTTPEERVALHHRAAAFFADRCSYAAALHHFASAGDHDAVASVLVERGAELVDTGHADSVLAMTELPAIAEAGDARIHEVLGYARQVRGQWARALEAFRRASADESELPPGLAWRAGLVPHMQGQFDRALELYGRALMDREDTADEALVLAWSAATYCMVGDYERCRDSAARATAAVERCRDPSARAATYTVQAMLATSAGASANADAYFSGALEWAQATGDTQQQLRITVSRACHLVEQGRLAEGVQQVGEALRLDETCGNPALHGSALTARAQARAFQGELEEAVGDFTAACEIFSGLGSRLLAWPLDGLGHVHRMRGELAHARSAYEEALACAEPCHEVVGLGHALVGLARVRAAGDPEDAGKLAERAVALGDGPARVQALLTRGWVALLAGAPQAAAADAGSAAVAARGRRDRPGLAEALELTAFTASSRDEAGRLLDEAIQIWTEAGCAVDEARVRLVHARLVEGSGRGRVAAESARQTLRDYGVSVDPPHAAGPVAALSRLAPAISIRALGVFRVFRDGKPVSAAEWQSRKARDLLKILVARRGPVPREELMELLWPEEDLDKTGKRLSVLLSTLRGVLGPPRHLSTEGPIVADGDVVWLDLDQVDVDVEHFLPAATTALEAHKRGEEQVTARLTAVEAGYGGEFLADEPYKDWAEPLRGEAEALYRAVLRALTERLREAGETDHAVRYALRLAERDRYDEQAHLEVVRTLLEGGRRGDARRRYQRYERRMTELGLPAAPFPEFPEPSRPSRSQRA